MKVEASRPHRKRKIERIHNAAPGLEKLENRGGAAQGRYGTLIKNMPCAVYSALPGATGPTTFMFDKWKDLTGYSPEELCREPKAWAQCIHPDDRERAVNTYATACKDRAPYNLQYRFVHRDTGQIRYVRDQGFLSRDEQGATTRVDGIITDVTELKEAQGGERKEAWEGRERYRALFDNAPDAIFLADVESGEILDANPTASQLLLRPHDEIVGLHQSELHPLLTEDDSKELFTKYVEQLRRGESVQPAEHVALRSDGMEVPVEITAQVLKMGDRRILQDFFRGITERKRADEALRASKRCLR